MKFLTQWSPRVSFAALFFVQAHATGLWMSTFSNVLETHGLERAIPYAFASSAVAAVISPLCIGSLADQHISAARLLRWLAVGTSIFLTLAFVAIGKGWGALWVLAFLQMQALCSAPTWGLASTIVLGTLDDAAREFGPIRVWATFGWLIGGLVTSYVLSADASPLCGIIAGAVWLGVAALTFTLPPTAPPTGTASRRWHEFLGFDALGLLRHRDHGVVFVTAALITMPLAAFYPFAAMHLRDLGAQRVAAAMSLGQVSEIVAMYALAALLARFRMKWILLAAMALGVVRYGLFAVDAPGAMYAGIALHGLCFTLFYIPAQIYVDRRIARGLQARAQALMTFMISGVGTLAGYLGCGWWREACATGDRTNWPLFWGVLCVVLAGGMVFFAACYRGQGRVGMGDGDEAASA